MNTELEKCLAGENFNGGDPVLSEFTLNAKRLMRKLRDIDYGDLEAKKKYLEKFVWVCWQECTY